MPLAFDSTNHGTVAFGFFNIETDMLLLEELFFFADRFCRGVGELSSGGADVVSLPGWRIAARAKIGNLHGAIAGLDLSGFIGATYERYPFPATSDGFKQNPEGYRTQAEMSELVAAWGSAESIRLSRSAGESSFSLGQYSFTADGFAALVAYVERGGYPRWRDEIRPEYVEAMTASLAR